MKFEADEVSDQQSRQHAALSLIQFPFDVHRADQMYHCPLLISVYLVARFALHSTGVYPYLMSQDTMVLATVNWVAWNEHVERHTDDTSAISPRVLEA